ncbi:MAG TPA: hypothetical protein PLJ21_02940 [Pseudobdellovibrionaceae bacterium]|nr:hypothetical protein [Pseudobdellovibrionaceae bacterium]
MNNLIFSLLVFSFFSISIWSDACCARSTTGPAATNGPATTSPTIETCDSFESFQKSYQFLVKEKELDMSETQITQMALEVSKNCTGAAQRFEKTYLLMKNSGVDLKKSLQIGLEFSGFSESRVLNFVDVFKGVYLENYFNFDFPVAYAIALDLSKKAEEGSIDAIRMDFLNMLKFCMEKKNLDLPLNYCSQVALKLCDQSYLFPKTGAFNDFEGFFKFTRTEAGFGLSIKEALDLGLEIIQYGPKAIPNFRKAFQFAHDGQKGLQLNAKASLKLSLEIAKHSLKNESPTIEELSTIK